MTIAAIASLLLIGTPRSAARIGHVGFCSPVQGSFPAQPRAPDRDVPDPCHVACPRSPRHPFAEEGAD